MIGSLLLQREQRVGLRVGRLLWLSFVFFSAGDLFDDTGGTGEHIAVDAFNFLKAATTVVHDSDGIGIVEVEGDADMTPTTNLWAW